MNIKSILIGGGVAAIVAIVTAAGVSHNDKEGTYVGTDASNVPVAGPAVDAANDTSTVPPVPVVGDAAAFAAALMTDHDTIMASLPTNMGLAADAVSSFNVADAVTYATIVADDFNTLVMDAPTYPGATSAVGVASISSFTTCREAWNGAASALESMDVNAITASTTDLEACNASIVAANDALDAVGA